MVSFSIDRHGEQVWNSMQENEAANEEESSKIGG